MKNCSVSMVFRFTALAMVGALCGCNLLNPDACKYELRQIEATGQLLDGTNILLSVKLDVSEQRDFDPNKSMYWLLQGESLKGHVVSAVLRDMSDPSQVLFSFPPASSNQPELSQGYVEQRTGANLNGFFDLLGAGKVVVEVRSDIAGHESSSVIPGVVSRQDWNRPNCS